MQEEAKEGGMIIERSISPRPDEVREGGPRNSGFLKSIKMGVPSSMDSEVLD
jgi:hypothetical protein